MLGTDLQLPVFLYGLLANGRTRAELRRGGPTELQRRIDAGELTPDFGPPNLHPTAGAVLVAARRRSWPSTSSSSRRRRSTPPRIAARIREGGDEGLPGLRAIGLWLAQTNLAQVSTNVEDHRATPLRAVVEAVARHAKVEEAELVGLAPKAAFVQSPPTSRSVGTPRSRRPSRGPHRVSSNHTWHRPSASAGASTAATPPERSRRGGARGARRRRRSARSRSAHARPGPDAQAADASSAIKRRRLLATAFIFIFLLVTNKFPGCWLSLRPIPGPALCRSHRRS